MTTRSKVNWLHSNNNTYSREYRHFVSFKQTVVLSSTNRLISTNDGSRVSNEKDLGITIDSLMKFHIQTSLVTSKALRSVGIIKKSFMSLTKETFLCLYKAIIRPQLEYGNVIWGPFSVLDQAKVERVQRRTTKLVPSIKHLSYQQRLEVLNLPSLKYRRLRGDMITVYNIFHNICDCLSKNPTCSHSN